MLSSPPSSFKTPAFLRAMDLSIKKPRARVPFCHEHPIPPRHAHYALRVGLHRNMPCLDAFPDRAGW